MVASAVMSGKEAEDAVGEGLRRRPWLEEGLPKEELGEFEAASFRNLVRNKFSVT